MGKQRRTCASLCQDRARPPAPRRIRFPGAGRHSSSILLPRSGGARRFPRGEVPQALGGGRRHPRIRILNLPWPGSLAGGVRGISSGVHLPTDSPAAPAPLGNLRE